MQESYNLLPFQANALDLVSDAVIAINNQNNIIYVNQAAIAQYGVERELATGQPLVTLFQCRWINPADEQSAERSLASTGRWKGENVHIKRDTQKIWVKSTVSVLKDEWRSAVDWRSLLSHPQPIRTNLPLCRYC